MGITDSLLRPTLGKNDAPFGWKEKSSKIPSILTHVFIKMTDV